MRTTIALVIGLWASLASAQDYGSFIGTVVARWNDDGRTMTLVEPFAYVDPSGVRWDAPSGAIVDGASIPQFAWSIIGGPFEGKHRDSSVIHDVACVEKSRPWETVHLAFYTGMLASGVASAKAKIMYAAVYHFGHRWPEQKEIRQLTREAFERLQREIESNEAGPAAVTLEQIREYH